MSEDTFLWDKEAIYGWEKASVDEVVIVYTQYVIINQKTQPFLSPPRVLALKRNYEENLINLPPKKERSQKCKTIQESNLGRNNYKPEEKYQFRTLKKINYKDW